MKLCQAGAELVHADRRTVGQTDKRTDVTKLLSLVAIF